MVVYFDEMRWSALEHCCVRQLSLQTETLFALGFERKTQNHTTFI
jgi:hypothetical protein